MEAWITELYRFTLHNDLHQKSFIAQYVLFSFKLAILNNATNSNMPSSHLELGFSVYSTQKGFIFPFLFSYSILILFSLPEAK